MNPFMFFVSVSISGFTYYANPYKLFQSGRIRKFQTNNQTSSTTIRCSAL